MTLAYAKHGVKIPDEVTDIRAGFFFAWQRNPGNRYGAHWVFKQMERLRVGRRLVAIVLASKAQGMGGRIDGV